MKLTPASSITSPVTGMGDLLRHIRSAVKEESEDWDPFSSPVTRQIDSDREDKPEVSGDFSEGYPPVTEGEPQTFDTKNLIIKEEPDQETGQNKLGFFAGARVINVSPEENPEELNVEDTLKTEDLKTEPAEDEGQDTASCGSSHPWSPPENRSLSRGEPEVQYSSDDSPQSSHVIGRPDKRSADSSRPREGGPEVKRARIIPRTWHKIQQSMREDPNRLVIKDPKSVDMSGHLYLCGINECAHMMTVLADVDSHIQESHPGEHEFRCGQPNCCVSYFTYSEMMQHQQSAHQGFISNMKKNGMKELAMGNKKKQFHVVQLSRKKRFYCDYDKCGLSFSTQRALRIHMETIHEMKSYRPVPVSDTVTLSADSRISAGQTGDMYLCRIEGCTKAVSNLLDADSHIMSTHPGRHHFRCPRLDCGQVFHLYSMLMEHRLDSHGGAMGLTADQKQQGTRKVYIGNKLTRLHVIQSCYKFPCSFQSCPERFHTKESLRNHLRTEH